MQRKAGTIQFQINGEVFDAKGSFAYNLGRPSREAIVGSDKVHGYKEVPQVGFIEGEITDSATLDLEAMTAITDATVTLELANGKIIVLHSAFYAAEGTGNTEDGNIGVRFEGEGEEVA